MDVHSTPRIVYASQCEFVPGDAAGAAALEFGHVWGVDDGGRSQRAAVMPTITIWISQAIWIWLWI
jgi:hypothetical protein